MFFDSKNLSLLKKSIFIKIEEILYPYKNALWALRPAKPLGVLSRHPCRNPKPLPLGEGLCMLGWLCIVQSPCAYTPGIRAGAECGAAALTPLGATPKARTLWLLAKSFARCKTNIASNAKHPFLKKYIGFFDGLKIFFLTILQVSEIRK
ncbi:hypothetical protein EUBSIR_00522 [[Eubacterium] siraeum DSM 15702]|uniref:Uncharacterized protein n=1 Tax=[Eubacterium] siraeum DSM 15702 TaxID=428128 RepID=B0ML10_9FIRM|nr:hypothetical protein EUBSIR_00522 [[Eubacterium] siraeum DSM 15702]